MLMIIFRKCQYNSTIYLPNSCTAPQCDVPSVHEKFAKLERITRSAKMFQVKYAILFAALNIPCLLIEPRFIVSHQRRCQNFLLSALLESFGALFKPFLPN